MTYYTVISRFPKCATDVLVFLLMIFCVHSVLIFELFIVLPYVQRSNKNNWVMTHVHVVCAVFIYINLILNIFQTMFTDTSIRGVLLSPTFKSGWRYCAICYCFIPPRSFHCQTCGICILKRDHHCAVVGCCVGHTNQRYFIGMIFYIWIATLYASIMNLHFIFHVFGDISAEAIFVFVLPIVAWMFNIVEIVNFLAALMITLCLASLLLTTALLSYHFNNILHGQTMYENTHGIKLYNAGMLQNIKSVFGERWLFCILFPMIYSPAVGNGIDFLTDNLFKRKKEI